MVSYYWLLLMDKKILLKLHYDQRGYHTRKEKYYVHQIFTANHKW